MVTKVIYTVYAEKDNLTFVMMNTETPGKTLEIECIGFYFGEWSTDEIDINSLKNISLKAEL